MNITQSVKEWHESDNTISPAIASILSDPGKRQLLYKFLLDHPAASGIYYAYFWEPHIEIKVNCSTGSVSR
ncbi:hypothetical protein GCM10007388_33570 [Pseudoduganella plicata]|uniref:Uncharacterized protein n=1 Tax=Pseudoduganella plicata TaxID=321984 RepID=A0AA87Y8M3_9BURK|nr:hypothetical protein GCM10007388_33570 [Pseudoduganella plicata]